MEDIFFSRIGLAIQHLATAVELAPHIKTEVDALSTELQTFEGSINGLIDQRVQARLDQIDGAALSGLNALTDRVAALEGGVEALADELDPPPPAPPNDTTAGTVTATVPGGTGDDNVAGGAGADSVAGTDTAAEGSTVGADTPSGTAGDDAINPA